MPKCFFCGKNTPPAKGKMFVRNDGRILYFCNSKCQKNFRLGRAGKDVKWTDTFQKETVGKKVAAKEGRREAPSVKASPSSENQKAVFKA